MPNDLIGLIREKQAAIAKLQAELDEARRLLLGDVSAPKQGHGYAVVTAGSPPAGKTSTMMAVDVLVGVGGQGRHVNDILAGIKAMYGVEVKRDTLVGNISRLIKQGKTFTRKGPNVFGLKEGEPGDQFRLSH